MGHLCYLRAHYSMGSISVERFFEIPIDPGADKLKIEKILRKFRQEPVTEELRKKIYLELVDLKESGMISSPFQVVLREDFF